MEVDGDETMHTYDPNRMYRQQTKIPIVTMEVPAHLDKAGTSSVNATDRKQLESRRRTLKHLDRRRIETEEEHETAETEYYDFLELMENWKGASNVVNPTEDQQVIIRTMNESVSSITLTGPNNGVPEIQRKLSEKVLKLKDTKNTAMAAWTAALKVIFITFALNDYELNFILGVRGG